MIEENKRKENYGVFFKWGKSKTTFKSDLNCMDDIIIESTFKSKTVLPEYK